VELTSNNAQVDAQSEEWFASYVEPSNQPSNRHRQSRHRRSHELKRQRLRRVRLETMMMLASVVFVGAMTACFYVVLTR
jgi:hypothetical protein